jgi:hypothetical protein
VGEVCEQENLLTPSNQFKAEGKDFLRAPCAIRMGEK